MTYPHRTMRALAFLAVVLFAVPAWAADATSDESLVSERLSRGASAVLDGMLGPGRSKVLVEVRGERLQINTQTEILTPLKEGSPAVKEALRLLDLPGYHKDHPALAAKPATLGAAAQPASFQKDFEHSLRDVGFEIKKIEATAVLDAALTDAEARDAADILPRLLRIDAARGDSVTVVRAAMRPAWKGAFSTPADWRTLSLASAGLAGALVVAALLAAAFVRGARVFAKELLARREPVAEIASGEPLPELMPGFPSGQYEPDAGAAPSAALGRRFDFLETADAANAARVLALESPADLAQVFAYLAKPAPETASRLFARLPPALQADASSAILKLTSLDPDRLSAVEERLENRVANGLRGSERLAAILSRFPGDQRAVLLERLSGKDARGVQELESQLFSFEDLESVSAADLSLIMASVPHEEWGAALRGASPSLISRVLAELPEAARDAVRERAASPQAREAVAAARSKLLDAVLDLAAKGRIRLGESAGEAL